MTERRPLVNVSGARAELPVGDTLSAALIRVIAPEAGAVARTLEDVARDSITAAEFGAVGDGVTDDKAALDAAGAAAVLRGRVLDLDGTKTYAISGFLILPAGLHMRTNGATFRDLVGTTSNTAFIATGATNRIDVVRIEIPAGIRRDRAFLANALERPHIGRIVVTALSQQANTAENDDAAVRVLSCTNPVIGAIEVSGYDQSLIISGNSGGTIDNVNVSSYVRGMWLIDNVGTVFNGGELATASANASYTAGHVGVLFSALTAASQRDVTLRDYKVRDAGEHGMRVGGDGATGAGYNENVRIEKPRIANCGGSGIKILGTDSGTPVELNKRIFITDPLIEDVGSGGITDNMCGILVMFADGVTITNPVVRKANKLISSSSAIRVAASQDVEITYPRVRDAQNDGIFMDGSLGALARCNVVGGWSLANGRDGYRQSSSSATLTDCNVDGLNSQGNAGLGFNLIAVGASVAGRPIIRIMASGNTAGAGACDRNAYTLEIASGVGATPISGIFARNGSTWNDHVNRYLMKAGAWVAMGATAETVSADPYWFGVGSLLNMAGSDGSTTFTDARGKVWTASGNAQIDTSLGYNTALFDGNDLISTPSHTFFDFGSGDWTIRIWLVPNSVTGFQNIMRRSTGSNFAPFSVALDGNKVRSRCSQTGVAWAVDVTSTVSVAVGALVCVELCNDGGTFRQSIGGVQSGTGTFTNSLMASGAGVYLGAQSDLAGGYSGHIKAIDFLKGACRHPGGVTFTPEPAPFWTPS